MLKILLKWLVFATLAVSCSKKEKSPLNGNGDPIIGEQYDENLKYPKGIPLFVILIKLNNPALLSSITKDESGQYSVDENLKNSLLKEQSEVIEKLKAISPDIKIVYRYRMILNALAIEAPQEVARQISQLNLGIESNDFFNDSSNSQLQLQSSPSPVNNDIVSLIEADKIHKYFKEINADGESFPIKGRGIKVGVIDSGIDYTHSVFSGPGDPAVHKSIDSSRETAFFPTNKVKGGRDFVGDSFSISTDQYKDQIPVPDNNPMDGDKEHSHGTSVSALIAGKGDGINTQDGIAPEAGLYALKVSNGVGTSSMVVLAAMEYAADPNEDTSINDRLDIINISIERHFGKPHGLYNEAITNLTKAGMVVIAAAGNKGTESNIIGAPGTANEAISVAASVSFPKNEENYTPAVRFQSQNYPAFFSKFKEVEVEGAMTTPFSEISDLKGKLFHIGLADSDLTQEQKEGLKGHVALIDRGKVPFTEKIERAHEAGAIGVVIINNEKGENNRPIQIKKKFPIPMVFITLGVGQIIKEELELGEVRIDFKPEVIEKSEVIDTMASFSSQGPRNLDSLIKPEITAPGVGILSAKQGTGTGGSVKYGTSLASPIVSGVAALLLQYRKNLSPAQVKSMIVNTGSLINNPEEERYLISRQGAGRVNAYRALTTDVVVSKPTISLGHISVSDQMTSIENFQVENVTDHRVTYKFDSVNSETMELSLSSNNQVDLEPGEKTNIDVSILLKTREDFVTKEANAFIKISNGTRSVGFIPVLAIISKSTKIQLDQALIDAPNLFSSTGQNVEVTLTNDSPNEGVAYFFNLLGEDNSRSNASSSYGCDLQSSGYRLIRDENGKKLLQVAVKFFNPVDNWRACTVTVEMDFNGDGVPEKILKSFHIKDLPWLHETNIKNLKFVTLIINFIKYWELSQMNLTVHELLKQSHEGLSTMYAFSYSTISIVEVPVDKFGGNSDIYLKVYASFEGIQTSKHDFLLGDRNSWQKISLNPRKSGYTDLPMDVNLDPWETKPISIRKGSNQKEPLILYFPRNSFTRGRGLDNQFFIPTPTFKTTNN